jgi:hypothetical protein
MQLKREDIKEIYSTLFGRLSDRGMMPAEITRLIEDVFNIIRGGGNFTVSSINQALVCLGWGDQIMDEISFELIIFLMETEHEYEVKKYIIH